MVLHARYAMSDTDIEYGAICLRTGYAMSGTDIAYAPTREPYDYLPGPSLDLLSPTISPPPALRAKQVQPRPRNRGADLPPGRKISSLRSLADDLAHSDAPAQSHRHVTRLDLRP
eukprot:3932477-Rhodomonas_salina.1